MTQQSTSFRRTYVATSIWLMINVGFFVGLEGHLSPVATVLLGLYIYCSVMLWKTVFATRTAPLELIFWLFHTNFFLLPALSQVLHREFFWGSFSDYREDTMLFVCMLIVVGLLSFLIGLRLADYAKVEVDGILGRRKILSGHLQESGMSTLFLIATLSMLIWLAMVLGFEFFTSSRTSKVGQVDSLAQLGMLLTLPRALAFGALLYSTAICAKNWRQSRTVNARNAMIIVLALCVNAVVNFPLSLSRFWLFGCLISLVWIVFPLRTSKTRFMFIIGMTFMQFTLFPWYSQITRDTGFIGIDLESIREYARFGDFDGFQTMINIALYVDEAGYQLGRNLVSAVFFFVPRAAWVEKADPLGIASSEYMGYTFTNLSAPIYGEFYADFGFFSLVAGMALLGFAVRRFDNIYDDDLRAKRFGTGFLITSILAGYLIIILRGSLLGVLPGIATLLVVVIFASFIGRMKMKRLSWS